MRKNSEFIELILLLCDAERTLPCLAELAREIEMKVENCSGRLAPLKTMQRALSKTFEKYHGDYRYLTDLARMTFECQTLSAVRQVLSALLTHSKFQVLHIKNRLALAYNASESGGYRDLLLNLLSLETGHIVEVQISLDSMMKVKLSGGHSAYKLARTFGFFKTEVTKHYGALADSTVSRLSSGILRSVECRGWADLHTQFEKVREALESPSCMIRDLKLVNCDWPEGRSLSSFLTPAVCYSISEHLECLRIWSMNWTGEIPSHISKLKKVKDLWVRSNLPVAGGIPAVLGEMDSLETVQMWGNQFTGSIPATISHCHNLVVLVFSKNLLTGNIPEALCDLENLVEIKLDSNRLTGPIPRQIGKWKKMKKLTIYDNLLSGPIPESIGDMVSLTELRVQTNQLTGPVPASLGDLPDLYFAAVSNNHLTGTHPSSFLGHLTHLYPAGNNFD